MQMLPHFSMPSSWAPKVPKLTQDHTFFLDLRLVTLHRKDIISKRLAPPWPTKSYYKGKKYIFLHNYCFPHVCKTGLLCVLFFFFAFTCLSTLKEGQLLIIWEDDILLNITCAWRLRWPISCRVEQCYYTYLICSTSPNCDVDCLSNPSYNNSHHWLWVSRAGMGKVWPSQLFGLALLRYWVWLN